MRNEGGRERKRASGRSGGGGGKGVRHETAKPQRRVNERVSERIILAACAPSAAHKGFVFRACS